ncbi:unnamed protein product [Timema podura]|uniref:Uncharacterized protein n=1 Tax=Timema podura TaxID=61482 RepID=A0ABN7NIB7_TIMPD|nr:unnamed protein product [Timema podura]
MVFQSSLHVNAGEFTPDYPPLSSTSPEIQTKSPGISLSETYEKVTPRETTSVNLYILHHGNCYILCRGGNCLRKTMCWPEYEPINDHHYRESPRQVKRKLEALSVKSTAVKKKLKASQQRVRRLHKKNSSLTDVVTALRKELLVSNDAAEMLTKSFSGGPLELLIRMMKTRKAVNSQETRTALGSDNML